MSEFNLPRDIIQKFERRWAARHGGDPRASAADLAPITARVSGIPGARIFL
jgi:hypothetical protein